MICGEDQLFFKSRLFLGYPKSCTTIRIVLYYYYYNIIYYINFTLCYSGNVVFTVFHNVIKVWLTLNVATLFTLKVFYVNAEDSDWQCPECFVCVLLIYLIFFFPIWDFLTHKHFRFILFERKLVVDLHYILKCSSRQICSRETKSKEMNRLHGCCESRQWGLPSCAFCLLFDKENAESLHRCIVLYTNIQQYIY